MIRDPLPFAKKQESDMPRAVLLAAVRTPIGKFLGGLSDCPAPQLGGLVIAEALRRSGIATGRVDEVIMGHVLQAGVGQNPARQAALQAGLPTSIAAVTINKVCGSGLKAVMLGAQAIRAGDAQVVVAGGMESMSRAPFLLMGARQGWKFGDQKAVDSMQNDGLTCPFEHWPMGEAAEFIAKKHDVSRSEQDRFAARSQALAAAAWEKGLFTKEVLPVTVGVGAKAKTVSRDESMRPETTLEGLTRLRPSFRQDGTVTAGNSSTLSDGAAALVVASGEATEALGAKPLAEITAYATSGVDPKEIFIAPVLAIRQVLEKANLSIRDIDLFEINEAFAAQMLACIKELGLDEERVNVHGGAIALGHPIGASGARVLVTLLHELEQRGARRGVAALCLGGGNAVAMLVER
jgi:acetyl-CoA C-acetyltransferase